ncbi:hypothetical protein AEST_18370 [Alishewanella aestuarii B11]|uniref:Uncharacterized protein n=1 Tax=Alishewanella aestuarii B11 TaxID=1197174 RepID=J1Q331_9ALTE|nr:hypothetical protein [Alishewanella aestuarii]EJI85498.1 hypothetical protein AEST_18370 [Alishewanella aestuarii B11]
MKEAVSAILGFYEEVQPRLQHEYTWKIPVVDGFSSTPLSGYDANVELKKFLNKEWKSADFEKKKELARFVVADWGGVRANKVETLDRYVTQADLQRPITPLQGVASYSKIFAIAAPEQYAIYDARVAACLNASQFLNGVRRGLTFNYVSGRNNIIGHATKKQGFVFHPSFKSNALHTVGWDAIPKNETYQTYLTLLNSCSKALSNIPLYALEMCLFAFAEEQCNKALAKFASS